jgi:hypothetical protein
MSTNGNVQLGLFTKPHLTYYTQALQEMTKRAIKANTLVHITLGVNATLRVIGASHMLKGKFIEPQEIAAYTTNAAMRGIGLYAK